MGPSRTMMWSWVGVVAAAAAAAAAAAQLSPKYYDATCPTLQSIVRRGTAQAVRKEPRMGASILRLFFHDCFVNGCDASVLLDDDPARNFTGEKHAAPNANSLRGYDVIDANKARVEASCRGTVSCADILALAARDAVNLLGGPRWPMPLGRLDARTTIPGAAIANLPGPDWDVTALLSMFRQKGLDARALTALSGAHTVGRARCATFRSHIYSGPGVPSAAVDAAFAAKLRAACPPAGGNDERLEPMEERRPDAFDNGYFRDLLTSDQALYAGSGNGNGGGAATDAIVRHYAANATAFMKDFADAMVKMGNLGPLLNGTSGEVRRNCRRVN